MVIGTVSYSSTQKQGGRVWGLDQLLVKSLWALTAASVVGSDAAVCWFGSRHLVWRSELVSARLAYRVVLPSTRVELNTNFMISHYVTLYYANT